jgi:hypothetical protein
MLSFEKNTLENKQTFIFIFIPKLIPKQMQNLVFFLKKNNFSIERITKKNNKKAFVSFLKNSNFILENIGDLEKNQLKLVIDFLNQSAVINGIFFKNEILNLDRVTKLEKVSRFRS